MSVVNAKERAGKEFIDTGCSTKHHEKRENQHNTWDDLESKVQLHFKSVDKQKIQFNSIVHKKTKDFFASAHFKTPSILYTSLFSFNCSP